MYDQCALMYGQYTCVSAQ